MNEQAIGLIDQSKKLLQKNELYIFCLLQGSKIRKIALSISCFCMLENLWYYTQYRVMYEAVLNTVLQDKTYIKEYLNNI